MDAVAARMGALALALVPIAIGIGRFVPLYVTPGADIWYQYRSIALYPSDLFVALTVIGWAVSASARRGPRPRASALLAAGVSALALAAAASANTAVDPVLAIGTALHLALLTMFLLAAADLAASSSRRWLLGALGAAVVAQAIVAVWQALTQSTAPFGVAFNGWATDYAANASVTSVAALPGVDRWLRAYGTFPHPNILGAFLAVALVVLVTAADMPKRWHGLALVAGAAGLVLSFSRSAWLAVTLALVTYVLATYGLRHGIAYAARQVRARPLLVALLVLGVALGGVRLWRSDAPTERQSITDRQRYESAAWSLIARGAPVGAGSVVLAEQRVDTGAPIGEPPHDVLLIGLAELGLPGIAAWLVLLGALAIIAYRSRDDAAARAGPLAAIAVLLPLLVFDHYLWTQPTGRTLFVWTLAMLAAQGPSPARDRALERPIYPLDPDMAAADLEPTLISR